MEREEQEQKQQEQNLYTEDPFNVDISELQDIGSLLFANDEDVVTTTETIENTIEEQEVQEGIEDTPEENKEQESPSSHDINKSSPFTPYARLLVEEGITPNFKLEEWDGTPQGLIQGVQKEIEYGIKAKLEHLDPRVQQIIDQVEQGVPFEQLFEIQRESLTLNNITDEIITENVDLQKDIARQYYKATTTFSDTVIDKYIDRLDTTGDLEEESKNFFEELKVINAAKEQKLREQAVQQREAAKQEQIKVLQTFKDTLAKVEEIVPGVKVNTNDRDRIYKGLTTIVDYDQQTGQPLNEIAKARAADPIDFETKLAYIFYKTNGLKDFSIFSKAGKKNAIEEFENSVKNLDLNNTTSQTIRKPDINRSLIDQMAEIAEAGRK